jgi:siroheme synthase
MTTENQTVEVRKLGKLIVGSMPLGNMDDITLRMLDALKTCDVLYVDYPTKYIDILIDKYDIKAEKRMLKSFHSCHADFDQIDQMVTDIRGGKKVLIVSSEGQLAVSDPGIQFIQECIRIGLPYQVLPGPNAGIQALVASGTSNGRVFIHPTIEPKNIEIEFPPLKDITHTTTVYIWGKDFPKVLDMIDKDFRWEFNGENLANKLISICCNLTTGNEFIVRDWANNIKNHPGIKKINETTLITLVLGEMLHTEECDHHICNSIRSLFPGQKYLGTPHKPIDRLVHRCTHPIEHGIYEQ